MYVNLVVNLMIDLCSKKKLNAFTKKSLSM